MDTTAYRKLSSALRQRGQGERAPISLAGADLSDARLPRANLVGSELTGSRLDHANLSGAKLGKCELAGAQLRWAELNGADFTAANLNGADLSWARVEGACFADADLCGASVNGATGEPATIAGARIDLKMCERSHLDDYDIIQLWRAGATIVDLKRFSARVQHACGLTQADEPGSEAGPSSRRLSRVEVQALRNRLDNMEVPAELAVSVIKPDTVPPPRKAKGKNKKRKPALSMRSMRLVSDVLTDEMLQAPGWRKGDRVMGVTLLEQLGEGNCGLVWRGRNSDDEPLAVKLFDSARARHGLALPAYRRGVQVMNRLCGDRKGQPRVVRLSAVSLNQLGFVMDLAPNGSAQDLPALSWPVEDALSFFEKLCEAIEKVHAAGVLHRCLKPSNILLDDNLEPVLTDFDMVDLPGLLASGPAAGGYALFAAPEELEGHGTQSPTADIYSLGSFLFFLLAGEPPPAPLCSQPSMEAIAHCPVGLARIIRKCTMTAPLERYQYVSELLKDVRNYHNSEAVGRPSARNLTPGDELVSGLAQTRPWLGHARSLSERPAPVASTPSPNSGGIGPVSGPVPSGKRVPPPGSSTLRSRKGKSDEPPKPKSKRSPRPPAGKRQPDSNNTVKLIATAGATLVLVSMLVVEFSPGSQKAIMAEPMRFVSALGGALMVFFLPVPQGNQRVWRLLMALVGAAIIFAVNLPALFL